MATTLPIGNEEQRARIYPLENVVVLTVYQRIPGHGLYSSFVVPEVIQPDGVNLKEDCARAINSWSLARTLSASGETRHLTRQRYI